MKDTSYIQRIENKYSPEEISKVNLNVLLNISMPTDEEIEQQVQKVFDRVDFKRHVIETANELGLSEKICEKVIKHYIRSTVGFFYKVHTSTTRIVVYTLFRVTFSNNIFNVKSKYHYKKHGLIIPKTFKSQIRKTIKKHFLKTESYEQLSKLQRKPESKSKL